MTGEEALNRVRDLPREIARADMRERMLYVRMTSITARYDAICVKTSHTNTTEDRMIAHRAALEICEALATEYDALLGDVLLTIERIPVKRYRDDLEARYIDGLTPRFAARKLHYSERGEREIHREAKRAFDKYWQKK